MGENQGKRPEEVLELVDAATSALITSVRNLSDEEMRAPSKLPGWSRGHVLSHLARNADSFAQRIEGALRGELLEPYPGGRQARDAAIESGAARPAVEILDDLANSADRLATAFNAIPNDGWERPISYVGRTAPLSSAPLARLVEVGVHHVDLGIGYEPQDWSEGFVKLALPYAVASMERKVGDVRGAQLSWHLHATDGMGEWLITRTQEGSSITSGHSHADCVIRGPGGVILGWLTGRLQLDVGDLEVIGDRVNASLLPELYPPLA
ncbi:MAG: maleylpyruvate isomerase family mycothiol-dependent enzyme [Actinobacteria bacterium]|jgi:maleylpyruvate isomerase|nr:maleylpyruvate isomerase family mycothiol-dependent enzyme [Actinomycetota bacterium]MCL6094735.1 maleylpyruvate isomerase family mycothiol-dependent enzyme [Actinomycetota bacterium]